MRIKNGLKIKYYNSNIIDGMINFKNNVFNGKYQCWYDNDNGQLMFQEYYEDDKRNGEYTRWFDNGKIWIHCYYKDDKMI